MITIRRVVPSDIGVIADIEKQSVSPWSEDQVRSELDYEGSVVLCAVSEETNECRGWCAARLIGDEAELLKIAVHVDVRCRGVGNALMDHLVSSLMQKGVRILFLEVRSNNSTAIQFYMSRSFTEVGRRPGYYSNPKDDCLIFRKDLKGFNI